MKKTSLLLTLILGPLISQAQYIFTVVGGNTHDGAATSAAVIPNAICADRSGNVYVADVYNYIRKINSSGVISTIGGDGTTNFGGDGGPATNGSFFGSYGITVDNSGNIYFADLNSCRIRKIDGSGTISTVAGNASYGYGSDGVAATSTTLYYPWDVAADGAGNLYIADFDNYRIRKVNTSGIITTVAGNGSAGISGDNGPATDATIVANHLCVDRIGNIFFSDAYDNVVRKVDTAGIITNVINSGLSYPMGLTVDDTGSLYIANFSANNIVKRDTFGNLTTVAGNGTYGFSGDGGPATAAKFAQPVSVAYDGAGHIYIADDYNQRVRRLETNGTVTTIAGGFVGDGLSGTNADLFLPFASQPDNAGNLYIADQGNQRVRVMNSAGMVTTLAGSGVQGFGGDNGPATNAKLNNPSQLAVDASGNVYIADPGNNRVRKVNTSGVITTFAGTGAAGNAGDGGPATAAPILGPTGLAFDRAGNLYVTATGSIRKIDPSGIITHFVAASAATTLATDTNGYVYTITNGGYIYKYSPAGTATMVAAAAVTAPNATGIAVDAAGYVYIAAQGNHKIVRYNPTGGGNSTLAGSGYWGFYGDGGPATDAWLDQPTGISLDENGNLFIADRLNARIRRIGAAEAIWQPAAPSAELQLYPNPTNGTLHLASDARYTGIVTIDVCNMLGQIMYSKQASVQNGALNETISLPAGLPPGVYILRLRSAGKLESVRFVYTGK